METVTIDTLDQKLPTLKDKYKLVKTSELIEKVKSLGYEVEKFTALKTRKAERKGYQKHRVLFTSKALQTEHSSEGRLQLLMTNSHDGTSSVIFQLGFFRFICSNGLVAGDLVGEPIRVRHSGKIEEKIEHAIAALAERAKVLDEAITKLKTRKLTTEQIKQFELEAAKLRFDNVIEASFPLRRIEDEGNCLFEVFNRVQEGLTKGGARIKTLDGKDKAIRKLSSFVSDTEVNSKLFDLALQYAA